MKYKFVKHPSKLSTLMIAFGAGSRVEYNSTYPKGIAHYMEHVRFKGTKKYTAKDLLKQTADYGGSWNAWTSADLVLYHMSIPEENIETAFKCLSDIILNPIFPEDELIKEQDVVCQEIKMYEDDLDWLVYYKMVDNIFKDNSLVSPIVGTEKSVNSITRDHITKFNKEFYTNEHMLITLGSPSDRMDLVEKYFNIPDDILLYPAQTNNITYKQPSYDIIHKDGQIQDSISIGFAGESLRISSLKDRAKIKVFSTIFGSSDTSRLFTRVREDLGLVCGIGSYNDHHMDGSVYQIYTSTEPKNRDKVTDTIDEEIEKMKSSCPTNDELKRAKNIIRSSYYKSLDSSNSATMQSIYKEFFDYTIGSKFLSEIDAVTVEDVYQVAQKIFTSNKYTVVGTGM
jgi:predicted Zn-dependent peptidase